MKWPFVSRKQVEFYKDLLKREEEEHRKREGAISHLHQLHMNEAAKDRERAAAALEAMKEERDKWREKAAKLQARIESMETKAKETRDQWGGFPFGYGGFSLVELVVVVAIIGILASVALGGMAMWDRGDEARVARVLHSMLRAARTYASTQNTVCAVGYLQDEPKKDTLTGSTIRPLVGAAILYQSPAGPWDFLPSAGAHGWQLFSEGWCVLPWRGPAEWMEDPPGDEGIASLGMTTLVVVEMEEKVPAHVFRSRGQLASSDTRQRFPLWIGREPDEARRDRVWMAPGDWIGGDGLCDDEGILSQWLDSKELPDNASMGLVGCELVVWKEGGRIAIVDLKERPKQGR